MADTKISALASATTPLAGTEVVPIVQGGVTVKVPASALQGTNGNTVLYGTAAPTTEGVDGDFYIRTTTNYLYGPRTGGVWPAGTSLVGPAGAKGDTGGYSGTESKTAPSISSNTLTLNCAAGNVFAVSLNADITTLTFSNVPTTGTAYGMTLALTADGTARAVTWGTAVKWPSASAPTLTSTNGKTDIFVLTTWDGGTTWFAGVVGQNY